MADSTLEETCSDLPPGVVAGPRGRTAMFRDPTLEEQLADQGVVELPIIDAGDVATLLDGYWSRVPTDDADLTVDFMRRDRSLVRELSAVVRSVIQPHLDAVFEDHQVVMSTFVAKHPGHASEMFLHDDRTFVDERRHRCLTIWTPLVDVGPGVDNGGLLIVPRSHRLGGGWLGSLTPEAFRWYEDSLRSLAVCPQLPAGRSLAYDTRVLHASGPNLTDQARLAAVVAIAPREARLLHVVATGRRHRVVYEVDDAFYTDHHPRDVEQAMPAGYSKVAEYDTRQDLITAEVVRALGAPVERRVDRLVPYDLRRPADPERLMDLGQITQRHIAPGSDLDVSSSSVAARPAALVRPITAVGSSSVSSLVRRFRRAPRPRHVIPAEIDRPPARSCRDSDVVVLDPQARLVVEIHAVPGWRTELWVVEAPTFTSGVRTERRARVLDSGDVVLLARDNADGGSSMTLEFWNDGPGPLVAVLSRVPASAIDGARAAVRAARAAGALLGFRDPAQR